MFKVAFKKSTTSAFGALIKFYTRGPYCHAELMFSDGRLFSSDEEDGGTRWIPGPKAGVEYDYIDVPLTQHEEDEIKAFCANEEKCAYDKVGIGFSFLPIPLGYQNSEDWFCSEICVAGLQVVRWLSGYTPARISPNKLYKILKEEKKKRGLLDKA